MGSWYSILGSQAESLDCSAGVADISSAKLYLILAGLKITKLDLAFFGCDKN